MSLEHWDKSLIPGLAQWIKDAASPQLRCRPQLQLRSDPWPGNSICLRAAKREKRNLARVTSPKITGPGLKLRYVTAKSSCLTALSPDHFYYIFFFNNFTFIIYTRRMASLVCSSERSLSSCKYKKGWMMWQRTASQRLLSLHSRLAQMATAAQSWAQNFTNLYSLRIGCGSRMCSLMCFISMIRSLPRLPSSAKRTHTRSRRQSSSVEWARFS